MTTLPCNDTLPCAALDETIERTLYHAVISQGAARAPRLPTIHYPTYPTIEAALLAACEAQ